MSVFDKPKATVAAREEVEQNILVRTWYKTPVLKNRRCPFESTPDVQNV